jgi:hypothetical protein
VGSAPASTWKVKFTGLTRQTLGQL